MSFTPPTGMGALMEGGDFPKVKRLESLAESLKICWFASLLP
jgi:hypothetical protein